MDRLPVPANLDAAVTHYGRQDWLATLPSAVADVAAQWSLRIGPPFEPGGETSWVAPVRMANGRPAVLKLMWPHPEARDEAAGLKAWAGHGTVHLRRHLRLADAEALLIERCLPGTPLSDMPPPQQDQVVASLLRRLWQPPRPNIQSLADMCAMWAASSERRYASGACDLDAGMVRDGLDLFRELPTSAPRQTMLCTDLHAGNVLAAAREPWLVIDPKPHIGDPAYDVLQHMLNCEQRLHSDPDSFVRRMADLTGVDAGRLRLWLFARCVQEAPEWAGLAEVARRVAP